MSTRDEGEALAAEVVAYWGLVDEVVAATCTPQWLAEGLARLLDQARYAAGPGRWSGGTSEASNANAVTLSV